MDTITFSIFAEDGIMDCGEISFEIIILNEMTWIQVQRNLCTRIHKDS